MTLIEVKEWGDFDTPITSAVMYSKKDWSHDCLIKDFMDNEKSRIKSLNFTIKTSKEKCEVQDLNYKDCNDISNNFVYYLKKKGFVNLLDKSIQAIFKD